MRKTAIRAILFLLVLSCFLPVLAEENANVPSVKEVFVQIGESSVAYPQLEGLADEDIQNAINNDVVTAAELPMLLNALSSAAQTPWGLRVTYDSAICGNRVFSVLIRAVGKIGTQRDAAQSCALCYDLQTGNRLSFSDFFADADSAVLWMEETAQASLDAEMTEYSEFSGVSPLPTENFHVDANGITFAFPQEQWRTEKSCGELQFRWEELTDYLLNDADTLPAALGLLEPEKPDAQTVLAIAGGGSIPGIPVTIGQSMTEVDEALTVSRTPDKDPAGRRFVLSAPCMRDMFLLSDDLLPGWDSSHVQGIQMRRGGFGGLIVGKTPREDWLSALGEPAQTLDLTESMADAYGLCEGQYDIYSCGSFCLRLYSDAQGVLTAIQLNE